jgi:acyl-CoA dehydrogenase
MRGLPHLDWPFFEDAHRDLVARLSDWAELRFGTRIGMASTGEARDQAALDATCRSLVAELGAAGVARCAVPATGGAAEPAFDVRSITLTRELLAWHDGLADFAFAMQGLGSGAISLAGSPELKTRYLPAVAAGRTIAGFALSEPEAGSDPGGMITRAVRDGDEWVINGTKNWITNAGIADFYVVFAVTDHENRRVSAFVVEKDREGFSVPKFEHKMGIHGSPTGQPVLEDVRVPAENVIGEAGRGMAVALATLERTRLGAAAQAVGIAQGAIDYANDYAKERTAFGKPINELQGIQFKLADMQTKTAAARELLYKACAMADRGDPQLGMYTSMAKLFASDTAMEVTVEAVQVLGGYGYVNEYPVERMMRDAKITQIYEGTNEIQRVVIARHMR